MKKGHVDVELLEASNFERESGLDKKSKKIVNRMKKYIQEYAMEKEEYELARKKIIDIVDKDEYDENKVKEYVNNFIENELEVDINRNTKTYFLLGQLYYVYGIIVAVATVCKLVEIGAIFYQGHKIGHENIVLALQQISLAFIYIANGMAVKKYYLNLLRKQMLVYLAGTLLAVESIVCISTLWFMEFGMREIISRGIHIIIAIFYIMETKNSIDIQKIKD